MSAPVTAIVSEQRLASAGWVPVPAVMAGRAVKFLSSEYPRGFIHSTLDEVKGEYIPETTPHLEEVRATLEKHLENPPATPRAMVDGQPVSELAVLIKPVAFLVTLEHGTHELGRVYLQNGKFSVGVDLQRIGGIGIDHVEYRTGAGLRVSLDHGYELFVPSSHCQATWRL